MKYLYINESKHIMIIILNPQFVIRNEDRCSYIIKKNWEIDSAIKREDDLVILIPPVIGYILNTIGSAEYNTSLEFLSENLGVSKEAIRHRYILDVMFQ